MFGCCSHSKTCTIIAAGVAGAVAGAIGVRAIDATPVTAPAGTENVAFQPEMDPEAMMAMMQEWAATVEQHELLEVMAGEWDCTTEFQVGGPEPVKGKGTTQSQLVLGGRFVTQHFTMPDFMGMPFEGMGAVGYDKGKGKFVNVWMDNFSTGFMTMEGEFDEKTRTMTWTGNAAYPDGLGGVAEVPIKHVIKHVSDDEMIMEFWEPNPATGELMRNGVINYTRR